MEHESKPTRARTVIAFGALVAAILVIALVVMTRGPLPSGAARSSIPSDATVSEPAPRDKPIAATPSVEGTPLSAATRSTEPPTDSATDERRFAFECGNVVFAVRTIPGEATLFAPQLVGNDPIVLRQTPVASGAKYSDGETVFWNKGNVATIELRGQVYVDCAENRLRGLLGHAQAIGDIVWATGNEPPWTLDIHPQKLTLTMGSDAPYEFPYRDRVETGERTTYRSTVGTQEIMAVVDNRACNDSKSGEAFQATIAVTFEQRTFYGCAALFPLNMPRPE